MDIEHLNIDRIYRAFHPSEKITDPELFVGRAREIERGILALMNRGGFLAILGLRGVGKSSIAYQIKLIAEGRRDLVEHLDLARFLPRKGFSFLVEYYQCSEFDKDIPTMIARILNSPSLAALLSKNRKLAGEVKEVSRLVGGASALGLHAEVEKTTEFTHSVSSDDVIQLFRRTLDGITKEYWQKKTGFLLLIDEFDVVGDKRGFASLLRTCSTEFVKFGIVGVASNLTELLREHFSVSRQADVIHVPLMPYYDLVQIIKRAEHVVNRAIVFEDRARDEIAQRSEGFPYFTHLLGREAMIEAYRKRKSLITLMDVKALIAKLVAGEINTRAGEIDTREDVLRPSLEEIYVDLVGNSSQREVLLKLLAEEEGSVIEVKQVYKAARDLGIKNPSAVLRSLLTTKTGLPVLIKERKGYYRFSDPAFKVYVKLRNWKT